MKRKAMKKARENSSRNNDAFANGVRGKYFGRVSKDSPVFFRTEAESKQNASKRALKASPGSARNRPARIKPNKKHILSA